MTIGYRASQPHYLRHLAPIIDGLRASGVEVVDGSAEHMLVASRIDAERTRWRNAEPPRTLILLEHGAGQRYHHPSRGWLDASGGAPDPAVSLFLAPSQRVADHMADMVPNADRVVVGSPAVERLATMRRMPGLHPSQPVFTCHWQMHLGVPEAGSAFPWSLAVLHRMPGDVIVHAHPKLQPRMMVQARAIMRPFEPDWDRAALRASVLVADNTTVMWEALTVGIPVVAMTPPGWNDDARHGFPRFGVDRVRLPTIRTAADTEAALAEAISTVPPDPHVYDVIDGATARAVRVILDHVADR